MTESTLNMEAGQPVKSRVARLPLGRLALGIGIIAALVFVGRAFGAELPAFADRIQSLGALGVLLFILGYALATVAFVPGSLLTLAAGAVYGIGRGTAIVLVAATIGASLAFLIARYVARSAVESRLGGHEKFSAIDRAVGRQGLKIVLLLRLSPIFPFNALNYALGLTRVRFRDYLLASIGMLPGTLLYVYYGKAAGSVAELAAGMEMMDRGVWHYVALGIGLIATIAVTAVITRSARRALRDVTEMSEEGAD